MDDFDSGMNPDNIRFLKETSPVTRAVNRADKGNTTLISSRHKRKFSLLSPMTDDNNIKDSGLFVLVVGCTDTHLICVNSWGNSWGINATFTMPLSYLVRDSLDKES
jgi:C1A family cysteine protease